MCGIPQTSVSTVSFLTSQIGITMILNEDLFSKSALKFIQDSTVNIHIHISF